MRSRRTIYAAQWLRQCRDGALAFALLCVLAPALVSARVNEGNYEEPELWPEEVIIISGTAPASGGQNGLPAGGYTGGGIPGPTSGGDGGGGGTSSADEPVPSSQSKYARIAEARQGCQRVLKGVWSSSIFKEYYSGAVLHGYACTSNTFDANPPEPAIQQDFYDINGFLNKVCITTGQGTQNEIMICSPAN